MQQHETTPTNAEAKRIIRHAGRRSMTVTVDDGVIQIQAVHNYLTVSYAVDYWSKRTRRVGALGFIASQSGEVRKVQPDTFAKIIEVIEDMYHAEILDRTACQSEAVAR